MMDLGTRIANVLITKRLLGELLRFPQDIKIDLRELHYDPDRASFVLTIGHPNLPQINPGEKIPIIMPSLKSETHSIVYWPDLGELDDPNYK